MSADELVALRNERGAWCPHCDNRSSTIRVAGVPAFVVVALALLAIPAFLFFSSILATLSEAARLRTEHSIGDFSSGSSATGILSIVTGMLGISFVVPAAVMGIVWVLMPRRWHCSVCLNIWRA